MQHVVGLERLEAAGLEALRPSCSKTTDGAVKRTWPSLTRRLALELGRARRRRCAPRPCRPRRPRSTSGESSAATIAGGVDALDAARARCAIASSSSSSSGVVNQAKASARSAANSRPGMREARRDDGAAGAAGRDEARARRRRERHPVAVAEARASRRPGGPACSRGALVVGVVAQPDHHQPPVELVAVAPAQRGDRRRRGVGPGAGGVGVERGAYRHGAHSSGSPVPARGGAGAPLHVYKRAARRFGPPGGVQRGALPVELHGDAVTHAVASASDGAAAPAPTRGRQWPRTAAASAACPRPRTSGSDPCVPPRRAACARAARSLARSRRRAPAPCARAAWRRARRRDARGGAEASRASRPAARHARARETIARPAAVAARGAADRHPPSGRCGALHPRALRGRPPATAAWPAAAPRRRAGSRATARPTGRPRGRGPRRRPAPCPRRVIRSGTNEADQLEDDERGYRGEHDHPQRGQRLPAEQVARCRTPGPSPCPIPVVAKTPVSRPPSRPANPCV